jgi:hypothetical protein
MTDQPGPGGPSDPSGAGGRKRPGPTIDLEATEIASDPVPGSQTETRGAETRASAAPDSPNPAAERSVGKRWREGLAAEFRNRPWGLLAAAAAGAALVLLAFFVVWRFAGTDDRADAIEMRLAQIDQQVRALADRPPPVTVDPNVIDGLAGRVSALEAAAREQRSPAADPGLSNRLSGLEGQIKALDEKINGLDGKISAAARRADEIDAAVREARQRAESTGAAIDQLSQKLTQLAAQPPAPVGIEALANRIASLERSAAAIGAEVGKERAGDAEDRVARASLAAEALNAVVERGESFAAELAALQALGGDPKALAALAPFASSGVPSAASLSGELLTLMPALSKAAGTPAREGGVFARLAAEAESLVHIRPIGDVKGDDPAAILARVELRATKSDIPGALAELAKLSDEARAPAQAFIAKAQAREAALAASHQLASDALTALAKSPESR